MLLTAPGRLLICVNKTLKIVAGIVISALGLILAFRQVDLDSLATSILQVNSGLIILVAAGMIFSVLIRAWRWQIILNPTEHYTVRQLYESTMIGYFGNSVLPFRMGELLRSYALSIHGNSGYSKIFGTIILERILDLLGLVVIIIFLLPMFPTSAGVNSILISVSIVSVMVFLFIVFFGKMVDQFIQRIGGFRLFESKWGKKILNLIHQLVMGILSIRETRHSSLLIFQTLLLWLIYYVGMWVCFVAVHIPMTWWGAGIVLIMTTLSITIPAAPGYIGTYHAVAVYTLVSLFNADLTASQTFAVVVHAVGYIPFIIVGSYYFFKNSLHFSDVKNKELPGEKI